MSLPSRLSIMISLLFLANIELYFFPRTVRMITPLICFPVLPYLLAGSTTSLDQRERERQFRTKYINESLDSGTIRPSTSPVGVGFFFVSKKDKTLRPCINYRGLNSITIKIKYPLPLIDSVHEQLQSAIIFTKLDLRNAYHLVHINEAFRTSLCHFEYLVVPFVLTNAPAVFQAIGNDVLRDFIGIFVFVYLDDILIYSHNQAKHIKQVRTVLPRLHENQLFVKGEK